MTGLAGFAWLLYIQATGKQVAFYNQSIQWQVPVLIGVVIIKYSILLKNRFKTHKSLFRTSCYGYIVFLIIVILIEYKNELYCQFFV